jgi:hypothetical protein
MKIDIKHELKTWTIYFVTIISSVFVHELGHSICAWIYGYRAVPTPAKEYTLDTIPGNLQQYVSLGGIVGSSLFVFIIFFLYVNKPYKFSSAMLAGAIAVPGMYTIRFILQGRGHDQTEFQEAQSALGLNFSGHSLDWFFLVLFLSGAILWSIKSKAKFKILGRLLIGSILTFIFFIALQDLNNAIFDPIFQSK